MARKKLTDTFIRSRKPAQPKHPDDKNPRDETMDTEHPRLGLRVTNSGHKSFFYLGRFPGSDHPTRRLIGDYPATTLTKARETARAWDALLPRASIRPSSRSASSRSRSARPGRRHWHRQTSLRLGRVSICASTARIIARATRQAGSSTRSFCPLA